MWTIVAIGLLGLGQSQQPQQPQGEHPWEKRLRAVEIKQIKGEAYAEQATTEAKEIIKNRTDRLEIVERWMRDQNSAKVNKGDPAVKADKAIEKADAAVEKVDEAKDKMDKVTKELDSPLHSIWVQMGGSAGISALFAGLVGWAVSRLRKELVYHEALPSPVATISNPVKPDDQVVLAAPRFNNDMSRIDLRKL